MVGVRKHNRLQNNLILYRLIIGCAFISHIPILYAREGISIASGYGVAHIVPLRVGIQTEFEKHWNVESRWPISGYWEASIYTLNGKQGIRSDSHRRLQAAALAGVFRFEHKEEMVLGWPYVEVGVGLSWLSQKEIGGRDLGMHFQFEDRLGVGARFGENRQYDIGCKFLHFSNAYIGPNNNGINLYVLMIGYWF